MTSSASFMPEGRARARYPRSRGGKRGAPAATGSAELGEAAFEEGSLRIRAHQLERALVRCPRLVVPAQAVQQLGAGRVEIVVRVELEAVDQRQRLLGLAGFRDGSRAVQLDDRRAGAVR